MPFSDMNYYYWWFVCVKWSKRIHTGWAHQVQHKQAHSWEESPRLYGCLLSGRPSFLPYLSVPRLPERFSGKADWLSHGAFWKHRCWGHSGLSESWSGLGRLRLLKSSVSDSDHQLEMRTHLSYPNFRVREAHVFIYKCISHQ